MDDSQAWLGALAPMLGQLRELNLDNCPLGPAWCAVLTDLPIANVQRA